MDRRRKLPKYIICCGSKAVVVYYFTVCNANFCL